MPYFSWWRLRATVLPTRRWLLIPSKFLSSLLHPTANCLNNSGCSVSPFRISLFESSRSKLPSFQLCLTRYRYLRHNQHQNYAQTQVTMVSHHGDPNSKVLHRRSLATRKSDRPFPYTQFSRGFYVMSYCRHQTSKNWFIRSAMKLSTPWEASIKFHVYSIHDKKWCSKSHVKPTAWNGYLLIFNGASKCGTAGSI